MSATMNAIHNGSARKNLASQLDRLDGILDGLAEGLNEAVATAVKEAVALAVQEAVRGILAELLTNPELLAKLRANIGVPTADSTGPQVLAAKKSRVAKLARKISSWLGIGWRSVQQACASVVSRIGQAISTLHRPYKLLRRFRVLVLTAVFVGAVVGAGAYCGGPYIAAFAGWLAGFTTTLTVRAGIWLRRTFGSVGTEGV